VNERIDLPDDAVISLDWLADATTKALPKDAPIIALLPTINGKGENLIYFLKTAAKRGWRGVVLNRRGHEDFLRTPEFDIMGKVADTKVQIEKISKLYPSAFIGLAGVSAGSGLLVSYMGQLGNDTPVSVCASL